MACKKGFVAAMLVATSIAFVPSRFPAASLSPRRALRTTSGLRGFARDVNAPGGVSTGGGSMSPRGCRRRRLSWEAAGKSRAFATSMMAVTKGDVATVEYSLRNEDGSPLETPFDQGRVRILVGGGGFAPFVHRALLQMEPGEEKKELVIPPKDAFGEYDSELTATLDMDAAPGELRVGAVLQLWTGQKATVTEVTDENFKIDWNPVGAGTSLVMDVKMIDSAKSDAVLKKATFAGGCFWGLELAFQRTKGVVSTKVGYAQGSVKQPSYSDVCSGNTGHTEAVQVLYDPSETTYEKLLGTFFDRHDPTQADGQGNDKGTQYRPGVYYHDDDQRKVAEEFFAKEISQRGIKKLATELEEVADFFDAEDEHQQYLQAGGQDARKDAKETIRCYG